MKNRRLLAFAAAGVALAVTLTGCGGGSGAGNGDEQITLRFAWWGSDELNAIKAEQIKLFEKANPNIKVEGEPSEKQPVAYYSTVEPCLTPASTTA